MDFIKKTFVVIATGFWALYFEIFPPKNEYEFESIKSEFLFKEIDLPFSLYHIHHLPPPKDKICMSSFCGRKLDAILKKPFNPSSGSLGLEKIDKYPIPEFRFKLLPSGSKVKVVDSFKATFKGYWESERNILVVEGPNGLKGEISEELFKIYLSKTNLKHEDEYELLILKDAEHLKDEGTIHKVLCLEKEPYAPVDLEQRYNGFIETMKLQEETEVVGRGKLKSNGQMTDCILISFDTTNSYFIFRFFTHEFDLDLPTFTWPLASKAECLKSEFGKLDNCSTIVEMSHK